MEYVDITASVVNIDSQPDELWQQAISKVWRYSTEHEIAAAYQIRDNISDVVVGWIYIAQGRSKIEAPTMDIGWSTVEKEMSPLKLAEAVNEMATWAAHAYAFENINFRLCWQENYSQ